MSNYLDVDGLRVGVNMVRSYKEQIESLQAENDRLIGAIKAFAESPIGKNKQALFYLVNKGE